MYDVIIVGAGTAGLSAAIYALRAGRSVLVLEEKSYGGQIIVSQEIDNYPGIPKISGYEFAQSLYEQAKALGMEYQSGRVTGLDREDGRFRVRVGETVYESGSVILATGMKKRPLEIDREDEFVGKGISYCATCDGAFYKGRNVAVVGGGNTALEDALFLSEYCNYVYLVHRREEFRGENTKLDILKKKENVELKLSSVVTAIYSEEDDRMDGVLIWNRKEQREEMLPVSGLFVAVGQMPDNEGFSNLAKLDEKGYLMAGEDCRTETEGLFVAGDCRTKQVRQLATAAADGAVAALGACAYLSEN